MSLNPYRVLNYPSQRRQIRGNKEWTNDYHALLVYYVFRVPFKTRFPIVHKKQTGLKEGNTMNDTS